LIDTLLITIFIEGSIVFAYCRWIGKPLHPILSISVAGNVLTQGMLWGVLHFFFRYYLAALLISELMIWFVEAVLLTLPGKTQVTLRQALWLSLLMNLASFGIGWALPV